MPQKEQLPQKPLPPITDPNDPLAGIVGSSLPSQEEKRQQDAFNDLGMDFSYKKKEEVKQPMAPGRDAPFGGLEAPFGGPA